jgi:hypothetical protein
MARHTEGQVGGIQGKLGNVVVSEWNGLRVIRSAPRFKANRKFSEKQISQHAKFALATKFFKRFTKLLKISFEKVKGQTGRSEAFQATLNDAIVGNYPNFSIDYSKVVVAKGKLDPAMDAHVESNDPGKVRFIWTDNSVAAQADPFDNAILVAYCPELGYLSYNLLGATRATGSSELNVPYFAGKDVHTWMSFRSPDGTYKADSVYTGTVMVS